jgi:hypothetical protein
MLLLLLLLLLLWLLSDLFSQSGCFVVFLDLGSLAYGVLLTIWTSVNSEYFPRSTTLEPWEIQFLAQIFYTAS